jgi:hypothetical protein
MHGDPEDTSGIVNSFEFIPIKFSVARVRDVSGQDGERRRTPSGLAPRPQKMARGAATRPLSH